MKKKIGVSKSMKKYGMGGTNDGPGNGKDSIPSGSSIGARAAFEQMLEKSKSGKPGIAKPAFERGTYTPPKFKNKLDSLRETNKERYGDGKEPKVEYLKKGGSVVKSKMKMGGAIKKSSKKK